MVDSTVSSYKFRWKICRCFSKIKIMIIKNKPWWSPLVKAKRLQNLISSQNVSFEFKIKDFVFLLTYLMLLLLIALQLPEQMIEHYETQTALICFGFLGLWRYSWWMTHVVRSLIYSHWVFPKRRSKAEALWKTGWRPRQLYFMMTTFKEVRETTEKVLQTLIAECAEIGVTTRLFIGTGCESDEKIIEEFFAKQTLPFSLQVVLVRQKLPGKRYAIGDTLRVMVRHGLQADDPVVFMDGDTFFSPGCLRLCLPFFHLYPKLQALTTHERTIVRTGPRWVRKWLEMRFVQRDFTMKSYALSNKVLSLTGRMSIFRGKPILEPAFIRIIENDTLKHWLWGQFRFLSGDDKSTWYYLLKAGADMFYVPDASTTTIEAIHGSPFGRMKENLRRWTGNTLRNGARALDLGPRRVGFFIWWCLLDQRISIWTMLFGHLIILVLALLKSAAFFMVSLLWLAFSRLCVSAILFYHAGRIDMSFPFLIYLNQLMTALTKIYLIFRLPQQRWKNRGDQSAGFHTDKNWRLKNWTASYLTTFYCLSILLLVLLYLDVISLPRIEDFKVLLADSGTS